MKIILYFSLLIITSFNLKAQSVDYFDMKDTLVPFSCGRVELDSVYNTKERLLNLDTSIISSNIYRYYRDVANCYYRIWGNTQDIKDGYLAIEYHKKSIHNNKDFALGYWDIAFIYYFLGDCNKGDDYLGAIQNKNKSVKRGFGSKKTVKRNLC